jgi:outer membrane lipoprotein-sorting protein
MKYYITLFTLFFLGSVFAQEDAKSQQILDEMSKEIKSHNSFYVEFSANIKNSVTGTDDTETGKGWVKGDKFYASYGQNTIISNGVKTWTIVKEEKSVYEMDAEDDDEESINPKKLMTIWETGFKNNYKRESELNGEPIHIIYLYPKNPGEVEYHTIYLYISKSNNELKKVYIKMKDGTQFIYRLTKFDFEPEVSDSKFVFDAKKYPGYTVIRD